MPLLCYQAEKEEQAAIQHQADEQQQPAAAYTTEWGGGADQQTGEVSNITQLLLQFTVDVVQLKTSTIMAR